MDFSLIKSFFFGGLLFLCLSACHDKTALKQALIEQMVQEKVNNHIKNKNAACHREAMEEALVIADSTMIQLALSKVDTSGKINRPIKPIRPNVELPVDTTPIKPLFEDTIVNQKTNELNIEKPSLLSTDTLANERDSIR